MIWGVPTPVCCSDAATASLLFVRPTFVVAVQACGGEAVKVYEVASKGKKKGAGATALAALLDVPSGGVNALAFGAHARSIYVGGADHNLRSYEC